MPEPLTPPRAAAPAAAIIVAAGKGLRAGTTVPKQFAPWRGKPLLLHSVEAFARTGIAPIVVVVAPDQLDRARLLVDGIAGVRIAPGGIMRQESALAGLEALAGDEPALVLIHDAARPALPAAVIDRLLAALDTAPGAIPVLPVVDSLHREGANGSGGKVERDALHRVQTPQAFRFSEILAAHRAWSGAPEAGDDAEVARAAGLEVALVEGDEALRKVTFAADFAEPTTRWPRSGTGFDVHRLAAGEELWLCGVRIDHAKGLVGHSDADVALHAVTDAVLGAVAAGDIGEHFPPSDPRWRGAASDAFLAHAVALARSAGYGVGNVDLTIVCEAPRIGPHRLAMRARLAAILGVEVAAVSVKATTTERLGFTGRGEGIAAQAIATLIPLPDIFQ